MNIIWTKSFIYGVLLRQIVFKTSKNKYPKYDIKLIMNYTSTVKPVYKDLTNETVKMTFLDRWPLHTSNNMIE